MEGFIDQLETDKLLKLLEESKEIKTNHPFVGFLHNFYIGPGKYKVQLFLLKSAFKSNSKKCKLGNKEMKDLCPNIKFKDGYFYLNKSSNKIRKLIEIPKFPIAIHLKNKFEHYIKSENIAYTESYIFYLEWAKQKKLTNLIDKLTFKKLCKLYFEECVEKKECDKTSKRSISSIKSGTKSKN